MIANQPEPTYQHATLETALRAPPHRTADVLHKERCLILHRMNHDVTEVIEAVPLAYYFDDQGRQRKFQFDFISVAKGGRRTAVATLIEDEAGPARAALPLIQSWQAKLKDIDADAFVVTTDLNLDEDEIFNADRIQMVSHDRDDGADETLRAIIATEDGPVTIGTLVATSGLQAKVYQAIIRLIGAKELKLLSKYQITRESLVQRPRSPLAS